MSKKHKQEAWKNISGYEGWYQVSDRGRVRSVDRTVTYRNGRERFYKGKLLKESPDNNGYPRVVLCKSGTQKSFYVHQIVMQVFEGPCPPGQEVCHEDGVPANNYRKNLRYDTHAANMKDRKRHGTENVGIYNGSSRLTEEDVVKIRNDYAKGGVTCEELGVRYGVDFGTIAHILRRKLWKHIGGADCSDMLQKSRMKRGGKLSEDQVREIRSLYKKEKWTYNELATKFKVSKCAVKDLISYRTWKGVR